MSGNRIPAAVALWPIDGGPLLQGVISSTANPVVAVAGLPGVIIRVYQIMFVVSSTTNITFQDGVTALSGSMAMLANGSVEWELNGWPWFTTSAGNAFQIGNALGAQVSGTIYYTLTPPSIPGAVPYDAL